MKKTVTLILCLLLIGFVGTAIGRDAPKTVYPIVFAHGMAGFNDILGYDYWGDDGGSFVLDPCDEFLETSCNGDIDSNQKSFVASVTPFQSSEYRGNQLYNQIKSYMASSGSSYVNVIGHSQGGLDLRKAAKSLQIYYGRTVVKFGISLSSPHRGSPLAKYILDMKPGVSSVLATLAEFYGNVVYASGNDAYASLKQLVYNDYSSTDGITTGCKAFNNSYPPGSTYIAYPRSLLTTQQGLDVNPALYLVKECFTDIDGDGYATTDADNDGAEGLGDGSYTDEDDDGLVGLNSQHMGYRLQYTTPSFELDHIYCKTDLGYCTNLNAPTSAQMTSHSYKINQDHLDVIGIGPDTFDEEEFYAAITEYIALSGM